MTRPLPPEQLQEARHKAEALKHEMARAAGPEGQVGRTRREEALRRKALRDVRPEGQDSAVLKKRTHTLPLPLHQAATPDEKQRLEAEVYLLLQLYSPNCKPVKPLINPWL